MHLHQIQVLFTIIYQLLSPKLLQLKVIKFYLHYSVHYPFILLLCMLKVFFQVTQVAYLKKLKNLQAIRFLHLILLKLQQINLLYLLHQLYLHHIFRFQFYSQPLRYHVGYLHLLIGYRGLILINLGLLLLQLMGPCLLVVKQLCRVFFYQSRSFLPFVIKKISQITFENLNGAFGGKRLRIGLS